MVGESGRRDVTTRSMYRSWVQSAREEGCRVVIKECGAVVQRGKERWMGRAHCKQLERRVGDGVRRDRELDMSLQTPCFLGRLAHSKKKRSGCDAWPSWALSRLHKSTDFQ